jgi:hypothetical protein
MKLRALCLIAPLALAACRDKPPAGGAAAPASAAATTASAAASATPAASASAVPSAAPTATEAPAAGPTRTWSFDKDKADAPPAGFDFFKTGGKAGKWLVKADPGAPSAPNVLAQLDGDKTDLRFATAVAVEPSLRDARVSVRCKMISGKVDQACGVVLRFKDEKNYYVGRVNALEKNVNLYVVKDGKRSLLGGWSGATIADTWHEIRLEAKGAELGLFWDGTKIYETNDKTHADAGRAGLWIKADSVTYFDEFAVTPLG